MTSIQNPCLQSGGTLDAKLEFEDSSVHLIDISQLRAQSECGVISKRMDIRDCSVNGPHFRVARPDVSELEAVCIRRE
jgi:hypothetical protein